MDKRIKKYTKKDGITAYMFNAYLGIDEQTGKSKRTTRRGFSTVKSATEELKKLDYQASRGMLDNKPDKSNITFKEVYEEWFTSYVNTVRESTWWRTEEYFNNHILVKFGKYRIRTITTPQIQKTVNAWFKLLPSNYKRLYNYSASIFKYALKQNYINNNPALAVTLPKKKEREDTDNIPNFWNKEQLQTFFSFIDPQDELEKYTLFRLLAFTGIRRGECLALTWSDLDFNNNTLAINKTLAQGIKGKLKVNNTKTKKGNRKLSLDSTTVSYLKRWKLEQRRIYLMLGFNVNSDDQLIFATTKNTFKSLNTPRKWLYQVLDNVGCTLPPITIHGFRHSHASALFSAGASIKEVQERLGHEDAQTTLNIYTHVTEKQDKEAVDKLVNFLDF